MPAHQARWLVLGARGKVGSALARAALPANVTLTSLDRDDCDIQNPVDVRRALSEFRPDLVFNCAAWTDVDGAETRRHEAWRANSVGPAVLASEIASSVANTHLIHLSTDFVFGPASVTSRALVESDRPDPVSVYGASKLAGEAAVLHLLPNRALVVRTAWVYGPSKTDFVGKMLALATAGRGADVVSDQWGSPTYVLDLARVLVDLGQRSWPCGLPSGLIHVANAGHTSRFEFAQAIYEAVGADPSLVRMVPTRPKEGLAPRPGWSPLSSDRLSALGLEPLRGWSDALAEAVSLITAD